MSRVFYSFARLRAARCWRTGRGTTTQRSLPLISLPPLRPTPSSPFRSFSLSSHPCSFIRSVSPSQPLLLSLPFVLASSWLYLSCIHPLCSPTDCQNHPSDETQTVLPNVCATRSLAICISFVSRHRIFRERVLSGDFRSSCRMAEAGANPVCVANLRHRSSLHLCRESSIEC